MNILDAAKRTAIVQALVEGNSVKATCRLTGVAKGTVLKLIADLGAACLAYHDAHVHNVKSRRIQADEVRSFVGAKAKNVPKEKVGEYGDAWTWTAIDADSKLVVAYMIGQRDAATAIDFMQDVAARLANREQLTTDGHRAYLQADDNAFGDDIDYAMLHKVYGGAEKTEARYSPARFVTCNSYDVVGEPAAKHVSTSFVERQNLTMRMSMRRFTRLTNAFSKKLANLRHAVAIHFMYYNYVCPHQTLKATPAQVAKLADRAWTIEDLVALLPGWGSK
jgi:IS1 family transposase